MKMNKRTGAVIVASLLLASACAVGEDTDESVAAAALSAAEATIKQQAAEIEELSAELVDARMELDEAWTSAAAWRERSAELVDAASMDQQSPEDEVMAADAMPGEAAAQGVFIAGAQTGCVSALRDMLTGAAFAAGAGAGFASDEETSFLSEMLAGLFAPACYDFDDAYHSPRSWSDDLAEEEYAEARAAYEEWWHRHGQGHDWKSFDVDSFIGLMNNIDFDE